MLKSTPPPSPFKKYWNMMENEHLESKNGGLEDEFPFQLGDVYVPALNLASG